jgi:hypothetical protein
VYHAADLLRCIDHPIDVGGLDKLNVVSERLELVGDQRGDFASPSRSVLPVSIKTRSFRVSRNGALSFAASVETGSNGVAAAETTSAGPQKSEVIRTAAVTRDLDMVVLVLAAIRL